MKPTKERVVVVEMDVEGDPTDVNVEEMKV